MAKARYPSTRDLFLMCAVHGIVLGMFSDKVQGDGNLYRGLYASEVEVLRDREIPADLPEEEFRSVRSASTCLQKCLGVPKCLSFQWNLMEGRCKLYNNSFSSSDNSQIGNRYYTVIKDGCHQDGYLYNSRLSLCWRPFSQKMNYSEALQTCLRDRGRLLRVSSLPIWEYLKTELAEHSMSLFWVQGTTNGTHVVYDDGTVADFMSLGFEGGAEELDPGGRFIIARDQDFQWMNVWPGSKNGFLCQVASKTGPDTKGSEQEALYMY
ncbi:uncharacterized protein LOC128193046 [Crassostrea angulata]|uniref:uncharacterized protein LOC128193046 n=1 Tax=Magallana angulata TaxID=2784310 RepID=UPI0022B0CC5B|nr:uncharacterized protein LOC128193046 [Crassostrea angulata]